MIALIPALFMIVSGLGVILVSNVRKGFGLPWLISSISASLAWLGMLLLHWFPSSPVYIIGWNQVESFTNLIGFQLDLISWPYGFALATLSMAVIFTSSARIESTVPSVWSLSLVFGGLGILAVMAATPLSLILIWSLIDLGEFLVLQRTIKQPDRMKQVVLSYGVQLASVFLVSIAMIISRSDGKVLDISQFSYPASIILFLGALLRLGVFPRRASYPANSRFRRDLGTLLRGVQPATGLVLMARIPDLNLPESGLTIFRLFIAVAALYGSVRWMTAHDETESRPFWVIGTAGLAILSVLNGYQITSMVWGLILILVGGVLGLYSSRDAKIQYIPVLTILGFLGLPYTPAAGGWVGLVNTPFSIFTIFYFLIHLVLVLGLIRHLFRPGEPYIHLERWIRVIYPAGLLILVVAQWILATWGWPGSYTAGVWWASFIPLILIVAGYFLWTYTTLWEKNKEKILRWNFLLRKYFFGPVTAILNGKWLLYLLGVLFDLIGQIARTLTRLLEGEGGFLWVLLLLTVLVTFVTTLGAQ